MAAQHDLCVDGQLVAHDVGRTGKMPPALRSLMINRHLTAIPLSSRPRRSPLPQASGITDGQEITPVEPLLRSVRNQSPPFNLLCPYWTYDDGTQSEERCLSGCVATSLEQILAYYRYPEVLLDTLHGWQTSHYTVDDMLPGTRFDWDNYLLDYRDGWSEAQGQAAAVVTLACGLAVHMNYGINASGANTVRAIAPLKQAFGYGMVRYADRICYSPNNWHALIQHELTHGRPVAYTGHNMELSGHAFNIDGVDTQGYYHVNWGYNGDYDGWYDLDWLCPWEPTAQDKRDVPEGFFCNQALLMMHPSAEAEPLEVDTLDVAHLGVELQALTFLRQPDLQGFVPADFRFCNTGSNAVTYTYEVMTYLPTDTAVFYQADYVGLSAITLQPHEERTQRVYLQFTEHGERILGISHDDSTIPYSQQVTITTGTRPVLEWGSADVEVKPTEGAEYEATLRVPVANRAHAGAAGSLVTLILCPAEERATDEDQRHWWVLDLPAGEEEVKEVTFNHLQPDTRYYFCLRCPWQVQVECYFWTTIPVGVGEVVDDASFWHHASPNAAFYDLSGRYFPTPSTRAPLKTMVIRNGQKYLSP